MITIEKNLRGIQRNKLEEMEISPDEIKPVYHYPQRFLKAQKSNCYARRSKKKVRPGTPRRVYMMNEMKENMTADEGNGNG